MAQLRLFPLIAVMTGLSACGGGPVEMACDELRMYQLAVDGKRIEVPENLDALDPLREMPLPEASPRLPRPAGSPCIDRPPAANIGG